MQSLFHQGLARRRICRISQARLGFTLVELLIVIAIIGTLMALLLPAVNAARERARQLTCSNNLGQLAKSTVNYATAGKGVFPGWIQRQRLASNNVLDPFRNVTDGSLAMSWATKLLPQLDQTALWEQILTNNNGNGVINSQGASVSMYDSPPLVEVFACPSDVRPSAEIGYLSYVANTGTSDVDWALNGENDSNFNGIFQNLLRDGASAVRFGSDIKDGSSTTLLLSENIHKDEGFGHSWLSSLFLRTQTGPVATEQAFGMIWVYAGSPNQAAINDPPFNLYARFNQTQDYSGDFITAPDNGKPFTRPASSHPELFITAFVEGNTKSINANIEYRVYQQLMTPNGNKAVYPGQDVTQNKDMRAAFNAKPLSENDY